MGQLIEIELEGLSFDNLFGIYRELVLHLSDNEILQIGESSYHVQEVSYAFMKDNFSKWENCIFTVDADYLCIEGIKIKSPRINFLKFDGSKYDVNFNFDIDMVKEISENECIKLLHKFVAKLASEFKASKYFCGLDPAVDEDTRVFTNETMGPFRFPS